MPQERKVGADFAVSLKVGVDLSRPVVSDEVGDTLNYATLYEVVKKEMEIPSRLLEHVAGRIGQAVFNHFPQVTTAEVVLTKLNPPMGADLECRNEEETVCFSMDNMYVCGFSNGCKQKVHARY